MSSSNSLSLGHLFIIPAAWFCWRFARSRLYPSVLDNIPGPQPSSWLTGSLKEMSSIHAWDYHENLEKTYGSTAKIKGLFGKILDSGALVQANNIYTFDPQALHHIFVKASYDVDIYEESDSFVSITEVLFGGGILSAFGSEHRRQRKMLSPLFSNAQVREMVPIFYEVASKVRNVFVQQAQNGPQEIDVLSWVNRIALELIGQCGFGYSFDPLTATSEPHPYGVAFKRLIPLQSQSRDNVLLNLIVFPFFTRLGSPQFRRWLVECVEAPEVVEFRQAIDTYYDTAVKIYHSRKRAIEEGDGLSEDQIGRGVDFLGTLIRADLNVPEEDRISEKELLSQMLTLTFAATDTTSSALSRTLHMLAQHKDVQDRLREEVRNARQNNNGQDLDWNELDSLPYLDAVCKETLRLNRRDSILPLRVPVTGKNGTQIKSVLLPKGTSVHVSIQGSNRNPDIWGADAAEWKPERWLQPLPNTLTEARVPGIYSHLLTFLGGNRSCLGFKFSELEIKIVLALVVESLDLSVPDKPIYWQMTEIVTPSTEAERCKPGLPLVVRLAD
ncbi:hypothetical protein CVT26_007784 [Gymnopilus dilepis]|uniref:Cytochrome P450 n=1 Tax=Gymnopilus dilepis TaxID=231916 RepID=A0A409YJW4_9AGAR|nr:hypothetical protein CVT26_007784 [Gymnopilus dilepis]